MLSMPPATTISASPARIIESASITAFSPEPHTLLMVVALTETGHPAPIAACRAGAWPNPAGSTQPKITSSTAPGSTPPRLSASLITRLPSLVEGIEASAP